MTRAAGAPGRLALQTGRLDDQRAEITPDHELWQSAHELFVDRGHLGGAGAGEHDRRPDAVCAAWPVRRVRAQAVEALAVVVALAAPFAAEDRILRALAGPGGEPAELGRMLAVAPAVASSWASARVRFPHVYDPDSEAPAPIVAVLDGPRSPEVAALLHTIKEQDRNLADAIVLGADLEMIDLLESLGLTARRAGRTSLADMFEQDRRRWMQRAEAARARQRVEGADYGWRCDNLPPECVEAARAETLHNAEALLHPPAPD
ncbi:MAG: hypothetical protein QOJ35_1995 [Solirubrobacteraceae bacterium]|jgi:hypothetical protein|nr:hypothetical protein [Solirubrobacteraceae bacterium]